MFISICLCFFIIFLYTVDDGGDEEETNMRNGGDRGESDLIVKSNFQTAANALRVQ